MKTIPEPIQNCNHRLQNCNDPRNLNPSNSTGLNLQPLAGEFNLSENLLIMASQQSKVCCNHLPSPESIDERLRLWAGSASATIGDDQPEVEE